MGRPKKSGDRYACGKLRTDNNTAAYRKRLNILDRARSVGTVQAMLFELGKLTSDQSKAADYYQEEHARYQKALQSPGRPREEGGSLVPLHLLGPGETDERSLRQMKRFERLRKQLDKLQLEALRMIELQRVDLNLQSELVSALNVVHSFRS